MPQEPITLRRDVVQQQGLHDLVVETRYEAPYEGDDPFKARDLEMAKRAFAWLRTRYPGYPWNVVCDLKQGILRFNIPILMGMTFYYVINLHTTDIADGLVDGAGEILERYRLPRHCFGLAQLLEARAQYSLLVNRHAPVPT